MAKLRGGTTIGGNLATHYGNFKDTLTNSTSIALTGDVTGTGNFDAAGTLSIATVVGNDSHTHAASALTGTTLAAGVTASSLTSVGTITSGVWNGTAIANANLANSSTTIGTTAISLGSSSTTLAGLTSVTSTSFVGALSGNASTASSAAAWTTGRTITLTGDVTGVSGAWTGSGNISFATVVGNDSHTHGAGNLTGATLAAGVTSASLNTITSDSLTIGNATTTSNYITFKGTTGDVGAMTYVGERIWGGTEQSELLLFKANDITGTSGPDRIRLGGNQILFDTYSVVTSGTFDEVGASANLNTRMIIMQDGKIGMGGNIAPSEILDVTGNIKASGLFMGTATSAQYADLAENYSADATYESGTVLEIGGEYEVTLSTTDESYKVVGVVTTNPAHLMNSDIEAEFVAAIALQGRVPCKVIGPVSKGDIMVSAGNGMARATTQPKAGTIIGKSLENFTGTSGVIEVLVGVR